jgi:hypothetical protein
LRLWLERFVSQLVLQRGTNGKCQFQLSLFKFDGFHGSNLGKEQVSMANNQKHIGLDMLHAIGPSIFLRACAREACKQRNGHRSSFSSQETGHNSQAKTNMVNLWLVDADTLTILVEV